MNTQLFRVPSRRRFASLKFTLLWKSRFWTIERQRSPPITKEIKNLNVLVVDDYEINRQQLCRILKPFDFNIALAQNGVEAMQLLTKQPFDIVFTDIVMPEMDGFELCEEIRKSPQLSNLPIVVLSTHCDSNYIVKALRYGADDYIPKPVNAAIMQTVLARVLTSVV